MAEKDDKDPVQDNLLREIDEELRQENLNKLWKKYGNVLIGAAVVLVLAVAGYKGWQSYDADARADAARTLLGAAKAIEDNKAADADASLKKLTDDGPAGYALLARFQAASIAASAKDRAAAYDAITRDGSVDPLYQDLARLLGAMTEADTASPDSLIQRLEPLMAEDNPWRHSAMELHALANMRAGDTAAAQKTFAALAEDSQAPAALRQRADAMALHLKD